MSKPNTDPTPLLAKQRSIYRNCIALALTAELLMLGLIGATWTLLALGFAVFGDPLTNAVIGGGFAICTMQIGLAITFAPSEDRGSGGTTWYPNVLVHVGLAVLNAALLFAMGVYAVIADKVAPEYVIVGAVVGLLLALVGQLLALAARFAPKA